MTHKEYRRRQIALGLCIECSLPKASRSKLRCEKHLRAVADSLQRWRKSEKGIAYRKTPKEKIRRATIMRRSRKLHPEAYFLIEKRRRSTSTTQQKLSRHMSKLVIASLKCKGIRKNSKTNVLVGCTIPELKIHLENQFIDGMTWENHKKYGWHIDHVKPCASFDLTDPEEQKKCFHFSNLQPLWWNENINKSARLDWVRSLEPQLVPCVA